MRTLESFEAAIANLRRMVEQAEQSVRLMKDGTLKLFSIENGRQVDETDQAISRDEKRIEDLKALIGVVEAKRDSLSS